jgi:SNF2 family DNA or RNA helicase
MELKQFQKEGVKFLKKKKYAILADEMGLGKTIQIIQTLNELHLKKVLIICPAIIKHHWKNQIQEHYKVKKNIDIQVIMKGKEDITCPDNSKIIIINYDLLLSKHIMNQLKNIKFDVLVCDESHYLKNIKAKRTINVLGRHGLIHNTDRAYMLTGTPILNKPVDLYPVLLVLFYSYIKEHVSYHGFARYFNGAYIDRYGMFQLGTPTHKEELNDILNNFMLRRLKQDVLKELPAKKYEVIEVATEDYTEKGEAIDIDNSNFTAPNFAKTRLDIAHAKKKACVEYIKYALTYKQKIVVFAYHVEIIKYLKEELAEFHPVEIYGGTALKQRDFNIESFVKNKNTRLLIGQIQAAGQGVDGLQHVCNHIIFVETTWSPGEIQQAVDRCHRIGQTLPVTIEILAANNTLESIVLKSLIKKDTYIQEIVDGEVVEKRIDLKTKRKEGVKK